MKQTVLVVDDEQQLQQLICRTLEKEQFAVHGVDSGLDAVEYIKKYQPSLVLLDIYLPDLDGLHVLKEIKKVQPDICVIMMSGKADIKIAVDSIRLGAYDFLEKPFELDAMLLKVKRVFEKIQLEHEVVQLRQELGEKYKFKSIIGKSSEMKKVFEMIELASKSNINVLITGESGTGKELIARAIHFNGLQKEGPFVAVDCGAIPENLLESELYGHEKGSFTGAIAQKMGKFEQAQNGTIFLDEIGDLPLEQQVKLLRVLQEREIQRVGGNQPIPINARFVSATNRNLETLIKENKFREDLYFRIHVLPIELPPLRNRVDDIPLLLMYFIKKCAHSSSPKIEFDKEALERLIHYEWPGNIRQLENFVERIMLLKNENGMITTEDIGSLNLKNVRGEEKAGMDGLQTWKEAEKTIIENTLKQSSWNISKTAKLLHISRDTLYRKMRNFSLHK